MRFAATLPLKVTDRVLYERDGKAFQVAVLLGGDGLAWVVVEHARAHGLTVGLEPGAHVNRLAVQAAIAQGIRALIHWNEDYFTDCACHGGRRPGWVRHERSERPVASV